MSNNYLKLNEEFIIDELAEKAGGYFAFPAKESIEYTELLFSICEKYGIHYYKATPKEKYFVEEITRVTWAREHGLECALSFE